MEAVSGLNCEYQDVPLLGLDTKTVRPDESGIRACAVQADAAIAETGTVIICSTDEDKRLSTCLAEALHVVVPESAITASLTDNAGFLREKTAEDAFIAFITGASRTADIERVLTIGVHGPCEMYVYIVTDR